MSRADTNNTIDLLKKIEERGMTKVIIEHDMHVVFSLAVQDQRPRPGHASSPRARLTRSSGNPKVQEAYLGRSPFMSDCHAILRRIRRRPQSLRPGSAHARLFLRRDIHAYYGESYIVQGVGFDIREGEILALLGRNGAGKTSTLRTIARAGRSPA